MNCWHCNTEVIWGGDHESEIDGYLICSNFHCPECQSVVYVYLPEPEDEEEL